jgi:hypothetical protein
MDEADQYAVMELFRGTMTRHSLIAQRDDSLLPSRPIDWDGDTWRHHVALMPSTVVVVEDRLPSGMAGAVINRAHIDPDLVCFLTADELAVFSTIDGTTSLGEIPGASSPLLQRLWLHDLVLIDASEPRSDKPVS